MANQALDYSAVKLIAFRVLARHVPPRIEVGRIGRCDLLCRIDLFVDEGVWVSGNHQTLQVEVPWSDHVTAYDEAHFVTYIRILDANAAGVSLHEIASMILGIDPCAEPDKATKAASNHLRRAQWMTTHGYRDLLNS